MKIKKIDITEDLKALSMSAVDFDGSTTYYECKETLKFKDFDIDVYLKGEAEHDISHGDRNTPPSSEEMSRDISCFEITIFDKEGNVLDIEVDYNEAEVINHITLG